MSFNIRESIEKWDKISAIVNNMLKDSSISELVEQRTAIEKLEHVVSVYFQDDLLEIELDDGTKKSWQEHPELDIDVDNYAKRLALFVEKSLSQTNTHKPILKKKRILICDLESDARAFAKARLLFAALSEKIKDHGFSVEVRPFTLSLFNNMDNYDFCVLLTHGGYHNEDKKHWIYTFPTPNEKDNLSSPKDGWKFSEIRGEEFISVSEDYIINHIKLKENAIILSIACQSLKENDNLAKAFLSNGASFFMGYSNINSIGPKAVDCFIEQIVE